MEVKILSSTELREKMDKEEINNETYSIPIYQNFRYFSPYDLTPEEEANMYVAALENGEIIGILKMKRYETEDHEHIPESRKNEQDTYIAIRYIDVRQEWKRKGVATQIFRFLNDFVVGSDHIVGSGETGEGYEAGIYEVRKKIITNCENYKDWDEFYDSYYEYEY